MKIRFDRLCQGPKINFLPFGTPKNHQNPKKTQKKHGFSIFSPMGPARATPARAGGPESENPKIQNPEKKSMILDQNP